MSSREIGDLHTQFQPIVKEFIKGANSILGDYEVFITDGYRSNQEQTELYAKGRTKTGKIVTYAKAGESPHNYGLAVDLAFRRVGTKEAKWLISKYKKLTGLAEESGLVWGGSWKKFKDNPHYEHKDWKTLKNIKKEIPMSKALKHFKVKTEEELIKMVDSQLKFLEDSRKSVKDLKKDLVKKDNAIAGVRGQVTKLEKKITELEANKPSTKDRLTSRKWISSFAGVVTILLAKIFDIEINPTEVALVITPIIGFITAEGVKDYRNMVLTNGSTK